jgi:hypothetical protein
MNVFDSNRVSSKLETLYDWEQEERARNLRESGWAGLPPRYEHKCVGTGPNNQIAQATFGHDKAARELAIASEHPAAVDYGQYVFNERFSHKNRPGGRRLTQAQFVDLYSAVAYANTLGLVMNSHVSITWGLLGIKDHTDAANTLTDRVLKPLRAWYKYRTGRDELAGLYVHENGRIHGFHTHLIIAIPNKLRLAFKYWLNNCLSALCRHGAMSKETSHINAYSSDRIGRQWRHFQYLTKGIDDKEELPARVGWHSHIPVSRLIKEGLENPGEVLCRKKCGVANLIGIKARQTAGFRSLLEQGVTDVRRIYSGMEYLGYLRQSVLPMGDPYVRGLLEVEERVLAINEEEEANRKSHEKQRRQSRKKRRLALKEESIMQAKVEAFAREEKARREEISRLIKI